MKYYFPLHLNGGNRGCEAIAKGIAIVLGEKKENLIGLCSDITIDNNLEINKYISLIPIKKRTKLQKIDIIIYKLLHHDKYDRVCKEYKIDYDYFLNKITSKDVMVSTGGGYDVL